MSKLSKYRVVTMRGEFAFIGEYLRGRETKSWHYYRTDYGDIYHFRKEHMVMVFEEPIGESAPDEIKIC
jgi:hypothetical protein